MNLLEIAQRGYAKVADTFAEPRYRKVSASYDFNGYKRIYFVHIRKTGGTSINQMFLQRVVPDAQALYRQLAHSHYHRRIENGLAVVGWYKRHINNGHYYYAFSHLPFHTLTLPPQTFTFASFRDPLKRLLSHYNMLKYYSINSIDDTCMETEGEWLGTSFSDFLERIPRQHALNQLYMFSEEMNVEEAIQNVQSLSYYFFTDSFDEGIQGINSRLELNLVPIHTRSASHREELAEADFAQAKELLKEEYELLSHLREIYIRNNR